MRLADKQTIRAQGTQHTISHSHPAQTSYCSFAQALKAKLYNIVAECNTVQIIFTCIHRNHSHCNIQLHFLKDNLFSVYTIYYQKSCEYINIMWQCLKHNYTYIYILQGY